MRTEPFVKLLILLAGLASLPACQDGDARVVAAIPAQPGFPEDVAVLGDRAYVTVPAAFNNAGAPPSRIYEIDMLGGRILRDIVLEGQDPSQQHGLGGLRFDGDGRLYALAVPGGVVRVTLGAQVTQTVYATFPTLQPCAWLESPTTQCTPMPFPTAPLPNDPAFGPDGSLYVTDSMQAVIFRVPPGGGEAQVWFQVPGFESLTPEGVSIGPNGIAVTPDRKSIVFAVSLAGENAGTIFKLPLVDHPTQADLRVLHKYVPGEDPDDMAFAASGRLYVALGLANAISVLAPDGTEVKRYQGVQATARDGSVVPIDAPAQPAFVDGLPVLLWTNHAFATMDPSHFALIGMRVNELGLPLIRPKGLR
jgi:hypothetical protein